jgi:hypothetical protein
MMPIFAQDKMFALTGITNITAGLLEAIFTGCPAL